MPQAHEEDWDVLLRLFPADWEQLARRSGAVGRLRGFGSVGDLLRTLLLHVGPGYSLRETAVRAKAAGWAEVSDVALLKRLRAAGEWWRLLCVALLREQADNAAVEPVRLVDGSLICEPGPTGSRWWLHYSLRLPSLACDHFELTPAAGAGTGERLDRFALAAGEIVLADRAYIHPQALGWAAAQKVGLVVRYSSGSTPLLDGRGRRWPLLPRLRPLRPGRSAAWRVHVRTDAGLLDGRLCAIAKSAQATVQARRKILKRAQRSQVQVRPETLELAAFVLVWTNLDASFDAARVLALYRQRWQIELAFKRLKSLAQLGHLPKRDPESSRAWLYGKLLLSLLGQKLARQGRDVSPWGYPLERAAGEPLA
ncbi:MAG: IS4 family transposase [Planctomycetota bacterium]|jgi:hypothetical protein